MKKLIIGIGFTAFMAVTGLQAGGDGQEFYNQLQGLENWLAKDATREISKQRTGSDVFTKVGKFAALQGGAEVLKKKYPYINAQFARYQAAQTKPVSIPAASTQSAAPTLKAYTQVFSKLPKEAQKSCMAKFQENVRSFITKHQTALSRTAMLALFAGSIYWVYTTHPEMIESVKEDARSAFSFVTQTIPSFFTQTIPSYASSALNTTKNLWAEILKLNDSAYTQETLQIAGPTAQWHAEVEAAQATQAAREAVLKATFNEASFKPAQTAVFKAVQERAAQAAQEAVAEAQSYVLGNQTALASAEAVLQNAPRLTSSSWWQNFLHADTIQTTYAVAKEAVLKATNALKAATEGSMRANATLSSLLENN